ncbi:MAG: hypothetical protein AAF231_00130 [Pseudomonadota bacterium]
MPDLTDEELMQKINRAMQFHQSTTVDMNGSFAIMAHGFALVQEQSKRPDMRKQSMNTGNMMSGAMIVYLFAMWDQFFELDDIQKYFEEDEKQVFYAFKHLRHVFAHNIFGERKGNKAGQDRMSHADKLDAIMASEAAYTSIRCTNDRVVLTFPDAFLDCQNFLAKMALLLGCGRFSTIGAGKPIRTVPPLSDQDRT